MVRGFVLSPARPDDIEVLVRHRHGMFSDIGGRTEPSIRRHDRRYRRWAIERLGRGELKGVIVRDLNGNAVASGCVWFRDEQPRPETTFLRSAYILSVYTEPGGRRKGFGRQVTRWLVREARMRGFTRVNLHASPQGLFLYERLGFERTREMRLVLDPRRESRSPPVARTRRKLWRAPLIRAAERNRRRERDPRPRRARTIRGGGGSSSRTQPRGPRRRTARIPAAGKDRRRES